MLMRIYTHTYNQTNTHTLNIHILIAYICMYSISNHLYSHKHLEVLLPSYVPDMDTLLSPNAPAHAQIHIYIYIIFITYVYIYI